MGSGKSTLGKQLANYLHFDFYDLDKYVEENTKKSIHSIFENEGEESFRNYETAALKQIIDKSCNAVISTGGGTPCFNDNILIMLEKGTVIYLKQNPKILAYRLANSHIIRPLIKSMNQDKLERWIQNKIIEREKYYNKAHIILNADNIQPPILMSYLKQLGLN